MKAAVVYKGGGLNVLKIEERPIPAIKAGWSRIKVLGFGINHSEIFTRQGLSPSVVFPRVLGIECVGVIDETSDLQKFRKGQRVVSLMGEMGRAFDGSYEEYVLVPNDQIYTFKSHLSLKHLVCLPETGFTAFGSLKNMQICAEDTVLIRGATSGVGVMAARFIKAQYPQIKLVGSTRSYLKGESLKRVGFNEIVYDENGKLKTHQLYDKVLELIGPATLKDTFQHVREGGIVCSTGQLGGVWNLDFDPIIELPKNGYLTSFYSGNVSQERVDEFFHYIDKYNIKIEPEKIFTIDDIAEAHQYIESRKSFGKVIVLL
ncbi:zinc-binding dehydrogenase [Sharpea azabuensis]|uniref:zinc-binding dehydrogenase n=1 Tax=Sharpea azabuensis TaxID=322505 RepID=UPI00240A538A|nr:zinc-binding dehydrogenase [Sharpea azabuensis]MDD6513221.1 zinc-binding dehydrogenase [Sharpea azabuensis]